MILTARYRPYSHGWVAFYHRPIWPFGGAYVGLPRQHASEAVELAKAHLARKFPDETIVIRIPTRASRSP